MPSAVRILLSLHEYSHGLCESVFLFRPRFRACGACCSPNYLRSCKVFNCILLLSLRSTRVLLPPREVLPISLRLRVPSARPPPLPTRCILARTATRPRSSSRLPSGFRRWECSFLVLLLAVRDVFPRIPTPSLLYVKGYLRLRIFLLFIPIPPRVCGNSTPIPLLQARTSSFILSYFLGVGRPYRVLPFFGSSALFWGLGSSGSMCIVAIFFVRPSWVFVKVFLFGWAQSVFSRPCARIGALFFLVFPRSSSSIRRFRGKSSCGSCDLFSSSGPAILSSSQGSLSS